MLAALRVALAVLAVPALAAAGYLFLLTLCSARRRPPAPAGSIPRFDVVVPAHDEEPGIERTVRSLLAVAWPRERFRVLVLADNCTDRTAERARAAGAEVWERSDPERRGKGYALEFAFERALGSGDADALVVVDADTVVSPNLLAAFAARLEAGAGAVQARYGVLNAADSWRTRLMVVALAAFHDVRSLGRERLRLSCGLRGNGMCFARETLRRVPHRAFSLVEDLEYGIRLGEAGIRVWFAGEAEVLGEMVPGAAQSRTQRRRWEGGRASLLRREGAALVRRAFRRRDRVLADLAADLLVPPLSWIAAWTAGGTAAAALAGGPVIWAWLAADAGLVLHVGRSVVVSGQGWRGLAALAWAPVFVAWKLALAAGARSGPSGWVRTSRRQDRPG